MSPVSEMKTIRRFVCGQLRDEQDLSLLTLGTLKRRYLAHIGGESLSPSSKGLLKQVVEEELMKMQDTPESGSESVTEDTHNKRKRERENSASESECEVASKQKKSRCHVSSASESEDGSEESVASEAGQEMKTKSGNAVEELANGQREEDSKDKDVAAELKSNTPKKKTDQSAEDESDSDKSDKQNRHVSSDESEKEEKVVAEKDTNQVDSDSSSLPSLDDDREMETQTKRVNKKKEKDQDGGKKKSRKKEEDGGAKSQKDDHKAVVRLKRYISLCGERRNYKKLLDGCRSVRATVAVLKKELEELGVHGQPSIEKCKKVRLKKEEAKELAELDVNNIIQTQGRPKRRGALAQHERPPPATYQRSFNSDSGSDQENTQRGRRRATDWANLQGIISDDADSD
ncbi:HIRA-interacting protein 3 [Dunckerocampus dactyliophorus]|uniref:HIRA-interacting protein 3 n=1 Tax=Dunckerocampus dactyliophorus TaxID=161453 RepID=UPI002405D7A6|nr:HIRA-interacting protein 3 [Dunckerocampus dactyliophorus]